MNNEWECAVVGGGAAGLSAALVLGRARRRTLVIDAGEPSNGVAHGIGGLLGHDGRPPADLYADGRAELAKYPSVQFARGQVTVAAQDGQSFRLELADGTVHHAQRVLLATGMHYDHAAIPGMDDLWGRSVFHCPFCHGWETRDQALAVLAEGDRAVHMALLLRAWTDDIVVLTNGPTGLDEQQYQALTDAGVSVDEREIVEFASHDGTLAAVVFAEGEELKREGVLVASALRQRSDLATQLGVRMAPAGRVVVDPVLIDQLNRTSVPGVFAAGDVCTEMPKVAAAIADGSAAGTAIVQSLLHDQFGLPVMPWPDFDLQEETDVRR
ncbi:pyridine nucleotide-disulfide oxidoreductase [Mycobacterium sp. CBMA 234]|uniref:NAD(P)/FAD-dependent oxidoreductase n=1 Tax=Mycolicibacterium sp. CBMA 234 TaxID=1918495 RepID=UPI0012DBEEDE|nr:NAD(P)/FAD-dependent oxidoreductase [Mycolicibacterium sp. CBMA 234]MUL65279.1 pyridine nucleotide-disulfide oxidoreductase [Mycolicibacterium sp. CBMA 234]